MPRIRVLIVEDTTLLRKLLKQQLAQEPDLEVVGEAADGREGVALALELRPDVVLMDLSMPRMNGVQATERISAQCLATRIILLTAHEDLVSLGRLAGACECLVKGCTPQELVSSIRRSGALQRRGPTRSGERYRIAIEHLAVRTGLTDREKGVVEHVVGTELTLQQIAQSLSRDWRTTVSESSVKHALERVMTKIGVEPRTRAALVKHVIAFEDRH
jgi:two-component system NarL family response regulator